jgi:hypothetical protein
LDVIGSIVWILLDLWFERKGGKGRLVLEVVSGQKFSNPGDKEAERRLEY